MNSPPSFCVKYEISSKLEHLPVWVKNCGLKVNRYQYWQLSILTGVKNHKKLLLILNSPPSVCAKYKISSKLKDLSFLVQNSGLKDDRYQYRQVPKLQKTIVTIEFIGLDLCRVRNFIKIKAFVVLRSKLWPERWQVPTLTGVSITLMNSAPSNCSLCKISWKMVNLIPRSRFPVRRFPFPFLKIALPILNVVL